MYDPSLQMYTQHKCFKFHCFITILLEFRANNIKYGVFKAITLLNLNSAKYL